MKVFIKGMFCTDWKEVEFVETDDNDWKVTVATRYINQGLDVKVEQN